jgi:D-aspartate ligase
MASVSKPAPALVLGSGITALGVVRALRKLHIPTLVVAPEGDVVERSWWYRAAPNGVFQWAPESLPACLDNLPFQSAVLIPCSDRWANAVAQLDPDHALRFPSSLAPSETLHTLLDKGCFGELLARMRLPHPRTIRIETTGDLDARPEEDFRNAFLKPRLSQPFLERFRVKAFRVRSRAEAAERLAVVRDAGLHVVLQEFIPGPPTSHCFVDGFVDRGGTVRARFARRRLRMYPHEFGNSTYLVSIPLEEVAPAVGTLDAIFEPLRYRGIFSAEFKQDERDGQFKILEINTRPWWYIDFARACGVDVSAMAYRDALGEAVDPVRTYEVGRHCVYPYFDLSPCLELYREGGLSIGEWLGSWVRSRKPVFAWSDPIPSASETAQFVRRKVRNVLLRLRNGRELRDGR